MLKPKADIVITHYPKIRMILVDLTIPKCVETENIINSLGARTYGIDCSDRGEPDNGYKVVYSRAWYGNQIVEEIVTSLQANDKWFSVKSEVED